MRWWRRLRARFKYRHFERDVQEELAAHQAMAEEDARRAGIAPSAVGSVASRALGNTTLAREESRAVWIPRMLETLLGDIRYGARALRRQPSFTITAVATLAVAVGLNASLMNLISTVFLRPWPVPDGNRVVAVSLVARSGAAKSSGTGMPFAEFQSVQRRAKTVDLVAYERNGIRVRPGPGEALEFVQMLYVSDNFFNALAISLEKGSGFTTETLRTGTPGVVISDRLWRALFAGDEAIIGRAVRLNDVAATIVGVAHAGFSGLESIRTDAYIPLSSMAAWNYGWMSEYLKAPYAGEVAVGGRLRPGEVRGRAQAELTMLHHQLGGDAGPRARDLLISGTTAADQPGAIPPAMAIVLSLLFVASALVLLLACANLANLQLARSLGRRREIAVRLALGASRARVVRQLMVECILLAAMACGPAVAVAWALPAAVLHFDPWGASISFAPDWLTVTSTLGVCLAAAAAFGLAPALDITRRTRIATGPTALGNPATGSWRNTMLGVQIAISLVLLVSATLLTRGVMRATSEDTLGFRVRGVTAFSPYSPEGASERVLDAVSAQVLDAARESGQDVALSDSTPVGIYSTTQVAEADEPDVGARASAAVVSSVSSNYFRVLGIPVVVGRTLSDDPGRREALVSRTLSALLWPEGSPEGRSIVINDKRVGGSYTVVGVSADTHTASLDRVDPVVYLTHEGWGTMLVRDAPPDLIARLSAVASAADPRVKISGGPLARSLLRFTRNSLISAAVASGIGVVALLLAAVGVFGVFAFMVEERRREIGVRMALGARGSQVIRSILSGTKWAIGGGLAAGALMAVGASFILRRYLLGLSLLDVPTYATVAFILAATGLLASYVPARRAARVDPALTLRSD